MPRFKLKAFDPHNSDAAARKHWDALQRGETKHKYDLPPTLPGKRNKRTKPHQQPPTDTQQQPHNERLSLNQRRFQTQIMAAKGATVKRPNSGPDTELRDKRTMRKERKAKKTETESDGARDKSSSNKRRRTQTDEEREAEERQTRTQWEDKVATMTSKHNKASSTDPPQASPSSPPPPPREFAGVERIPFGFQVDRPPQHLTQLKHKRAAPGANETGKAGGRLSMEQYVAERQKAQEAYAEMRKRRREADKT